MLSHFMILSIIFAIANFVIFTTVNSVILWFCQPFSRSCQAFWYSAQLFYDFVSHSRDTISHFGTVFIIHFAKFLGHSQDSVSHSFEWLSWARGAEGGSRLGQEALGGSVAHARARGRGWLSQLVGPVGLGDGPLIHYIYIYTYIYIYIYIYINHFVIFVNHSRTK
jgi:hypothetical protein